MSRPNLSDQYHQQLSFTAHELCTPLTLIKFYAEALKECEKAEANHMADNIMRLSQELISSARLLLEATDTKHKGGETPQTINLTDFVAERVKFFAPMAQAKNITLSHNLKSPFQAAVPVAGLRIILNNLIGNALKFTPQGGRVNLEAKLDSPLTLCVQDTAETIPQAQRLSIFQAFMKDAKHQENNGFGLGLYVCQHLVDTWGTAIWVEPNQPVGNQFFVTLPSLP